MSAGLWLPAGPLSRVFEQGLTPIAGAGQTPAFLFAGGMVLTAPPGPLAARTAHQLSLDDQANLRIGPPLGGGAIPISLGRTAVHVAAGPTALTAAQPAAETVLVRTVAAARNEELRALAVTYTGAAAPTAEVRVLVGGVAASAWASGFVSGEPMDVPFQHPLFGGTGEAFAVQIRNGADTETVAATAHLVSEPV